jgi:hypothetical protein
LISVLVLIADGGAPRSPHVGGHELGIDDWSRSSISVWRKRMGEEGLRALLQQSLAVATGTAR